MQVKAGLLTDRGRYGRVAAKRCDLVAFRSVEDSAFKPRS